MKFGRNRDRCSEVEDGTIPYSNCSKSRIVGLSLSTHVPTYKNCEIVHTHVGEDATFRRDRDRCSERQDGTIPYSNCSKVLRIVGLSLFLLVFLQKNARRRGHAVWVR